MQTFHFIRHAQSVHNALSRPGGPDPMVRDAPLTELGHQQAAALGATLGAAPEVELVVVTPFTRAIQTALHAFAGAGAPRVIHDLHREHLDSYCDVGRSPADLARDFPMFAFDHLPDPWWHVDATSDAPYVREPHDVLMARVEGFAAWLRARPETTIAVVGHGTFLNRLTGHSFGNAERLVGSL
jgi:glucosyl-3-phosphoglycerate phosphatase